MMDTSAATACLGPLLHFLFAERRLPTVRDQMSKLTTRFSANRRQTQFGSGSESLVSELVDQIVSELSGRCEFNLRCTGCRLLRGTLLRNVRNQLLQFGKVASIERAQCGTL